jgi:hypothetical protein
VARLRILVLDAESPIALAACQALARAGHEVGVTCSERFALAAVSKHTTRSHRLPPCHGPAEPYLGGLIATIERFGYQLLIAVRDPAIARLAQAELPIPSCPAAGGSVLHLTDKLRLADLCRSCDVPYPATFSPRAPGEDEAALEAAGFPAFVKANCSASTTPERVVHLPGAQAVDDLAGGRRAISDIRALGVRPLVQESVRGEKLHAVIIRRGARTPFRYAHRYLRDVGGAEVALETIAADRGVGGEAIAMLERACDAAGYEGLVQAELYRAHQDGQIYLFDVNPRLWGSIWFPEKLGLRVVERAVRDAMTDTPLVQADYQAGLRYHHILGELRWVRARPRDFSQILRTSRPRDVYHPSLMDPLPIASWLARKLGSARRGQG